VKQEQNGRVIYYQLNGNEMKEIDKWSGKFKQIWESKFDELDKVLVTLQNIKKKNTLNKNYR
jgi:hypothetical protein